MPIDMSHVPPPKTRSGNARPTPVRMTREDKRTEAVNGLFQLGQMGCLMMGAYADAAAIGIHAENISKEVVILCSTNEQVGKAVDYLTEVGPYAGLVTAVLPLVMQVLANHKRMPATGVQGIMPPEVLDAQMRAQMEMRAAQAMLEAKKAQDEAERMRREIQEMNAA